MPSIFIKKIKEILLEKAIPKMILLAPEIPTEIADPLSQQLLITENDASTLRKLGKLV